MRLGRPFCKLKGGFCLKILHGAQNAIRDENLATIYLSRKEFLFSQGRQIEINVGEFARNCSRTQICICPKGVI
jgi:hypothetical protein